MKRHLLKGFFLIVSVICMLALSTSCSEKLDAGKMLGYQSGTPEYNVTFCVSGEEYPMHLTLDSPDESDGACRDGMAEITGGVLDGVCFVMKGGALKMLVGELEYPLDEDDSSALYLLFGAFGINKDDFVGATEDTEGILAARFNGKYEFTLMLDGETFKPLKAEAECTTGICTLVFGAEGTVEKATQDG